MSRLPTLGVQMVQVVHGLRNGGADIGFVGLFGFVKLTSVPAALTVHLAETESRSKEADRLCPGYGGGAGRCGGEQER